MAELGAREKATEIYDEFMLESAVMKNQEGSLRDSTLKHINALLDVYLDLWPELVYES